MAAALGGAAATPNSAVAAHRGGWIWAISLELALVHLTIGAAVVRYRLYDLDRIISRTLAYGLLTLLLGGGYALLVLGLGQLLGQDHSNLIVAGATLAGAAAFQPARRRIQQLVDRHFNRRRYDASQTIAAFSARLRQHVDLDSLTTELLAVVEATMQPTQASLWLKVQPPSGTAAPAWPGNAPQATSANANKVRRLAPTAPTSLVMPHHRKWQSGRLDMPPEAGRTVGPPEGADAPMINRAKRTTRRGRSTPPEGAMSRW